MSDFKIKVVSFDVDGTLTDGLYHVNENGDVVKSFYTRDFCGIQMLLEVGLQVVILTQSHDNVIIAQVNRIASHSTIWDSALKSGKLVIETAIRNKLDFMSNFLFARNMSLENLAHMGDAENDLQLLEFAGYTACPADAIKEIEDVNCRCSNNGGRGAVHEFCKHLLAVR